MTNNDLLDEARQAVLQCQHRFWRALENKDAHLFADVLAENFVCRSPGETDQDRKVFIATLTSIPITIRNISSEEIAIQLVGDVAVLTGTQVAEMRLPNGDTVSERLALTNIFQRNGERWEMILAHPVSLSS